MDPQITSVPRPIQLRIADDLRLKIERGELAPGDALPTSQELSRQWSCSAASTRAATALLKQQGLITGGRGKAPRVRMPPRRIVRSSERHQLEKDLVLAPEDQRALVGAAEIDTGVSLSALDFGTKYDVIPAEEHLSSALGLEQGDDVLRRTYWSTDPESGHRVSWSRSYMPQALLHVNPDLLDPAREPWPGGTQHQLSTIGIEIMTMRDEVTARMPTTAEANLWGLEDGVPMLDVRRTSLSAGGRVVEVSDASYPADRTKLQFVTPLRPWNEVKD